MDESAVTPETSSRAPDWATFIHGRREAKRPRRLTDNGEIKEEKVELKSEVKALLDLINTALEHQIDTGHGSFRIRVYQDARGQATSLLQALDAGDASHQLEALRGQEAAIKATFQQQADKKSSAGSGDDDDDDPDSVWHRKTKALYSQAEVTKQVEADPYMQELARRSMSLNELKDHNAAMQADIASSAEDGKHDLLAAMTVAAKLSQNSGDVEGYLKEIELEMRRKDLANGSAGSGASVEERIAAIREEGGKIRASMAQGRAATSESISNAEERFINLHLGSHADEYAEEVRKAKAQIASCNCSGEAEEFGNQAEKSQAHLQNTIARLKSVLHEGRANIGSGDDSTPVTAADLEGIRKQMNVDAVFDIWKQQGAEGAGMLGAHDAIYQNVSDKVGAAQQQLGGLLSGGSSKGADDVALVLGVSKDDIMAHANDIQQMVIVGQIEKINGRWKAEMYKPASDLPPFS